MGYNKFNCYDCEDNDLKTQIIDINHAGELDAFNSTHPNGHFMQTSLWGKVKNDWKWFGVICRNDAGEITGTMSVLLRKISGLPYHMMYAPRGPVCAFGDKETFSALIAAAKEEGKKYSAYLLKIDKDVSADNAEYKNIALAEGFDIKPAEIGFHDFQCRWAVRININGRSEEELFGDFHSKWRYNIRLAGRKGVQVKICGSDMAETFYEIMKVTCERDGFALRDAAYFRKILDVFGENARLYMAFFEDKPIAGAIAVYWGDKLWYFYGASSNEFRNVMPNYLVQWEMIKWAVEKNCRIYDFRGYSGVQDDSDGLYRFKMGFDGTAVEFMGEMDLITKPAAAKIVDASQKIIKKLR